QSRPFGVGQGGMAAADRHPAAGRRADLPHRTWAQDERARRPIRVETGRRAPSIRAQRRGLTGGRPSETPRSQEQRGALRRGVRARKGGGVELGAERGEGPPPAPVLRRARRRKQLFGLSEATRSL